MRLGRTAAIVFVSKFGGSLLGFIATVYLARALGAEVLGYYAVAIALLSWLKLGGNLGVSNAVTKRVSEGRSQSAFFSAGVIMVVVFGVVASVFVVVFQGFVNDYIGVNVSTILIPLILSGLLISIVSAALKGENRVHVAGLLTPLNVGITSVFQIGLVFLGMELMGMFVGYLVGEIAVGLIGAALVSVGITIPKRRHFESLFEYARYSWLSGLESQSFNDVDTVVLGALVNPSLVGIYSVAWSISQFLSLFGRSVRSALFPEVSRAEAEENEDQVSRLAHNSLAHIGLIAIPGFFGSLVVGDLLLGIYGQEFVQGELVLSLLVLAVLVYSYQQQLTGILSGMDRPDVTFRINAVFIVTNLCLNVVLVVWLDWVGAAIATVISTLLGTTLAFRRLKRLIDFETPVVEIGQQFGSAGVMAVAVVAVRRVIEGEWIFSNYFVLLLALVSLGAGVYFLILLVVSSRFRQTVSDNLPFRIPF
jgi:O-antigen/teichoic acid export membrane protein